MDSRQKSEGEVNKGITGMGGQRRGKGKGKADSKGKAASKPKRKGPSYKGTAKKARKRASDAIDPKVAIIASDPLRAEIVAVAIQRLYSPSEFAKDADVSIGVASYAFKVLREHDILELVREEKVRGAIKHMHRANEAALFGDKDWGALAPVLRPGVIGATIGNFNDRLSQADATGKLYEREDVCVYWAPRDLDAIAWEEHDKVVRWAIEESERLEAETAERRANGKGGDCFKATFGIFAFPSPTHSEVEAAERETREGGKGGGKQKRKAPKAKAKQKGKG
jgi:DNA-binding transcriptional ArsR family regulator